jgi:hypothetical protein
MNEITVKAKPGQILKQVECYSTNVGEMAAVLRTALIDPATDELKEIGLKEAVQAIQTSYDQTRETIFECAGTTFTPQLPDNFTGQAIGILLMTIGLKLDNPIVPDSIMVK